MTASSTFKPALVSWNLTKQCNLRCPHCYMEAGARSARELTTRECLELIDDLRAMGTEMLILTGGEPLLRKDIYEIARHASRQGCWVVMGTNGVLITDQVAAKMVECGVRGVGVSVDSLDPAKHNCFRGAPNAWELSVRALDICRAHGLDILVQTTVMALNYHEIPKMIEFARAKGAWSFNLYFLVQTGRGQTMNDLSPDETEAMLATLVESQDRQRPMLVRAKCAPHFKRIAYEKGLGGLESGGCMAGTQYCRITPEGDVTPCPYMTAVAGNVRERSFREIWEQSPVLRQLRDLGQLRGRCGRCEFKELCGGCRCRAYAAYGDYLQEDPACSYQPRGRSLEQAAVAWDTEALARLERIPIAFVREKVRQGLETYARRNAIDVVTPEVMKKALAGEAKPEFFRNRLA